MTRTLWAKFFVLLLAASAIALSAALALRQLMIRDFRDYIEGQREDRVYWITADAERTYERHGGWDPEAMEEDAAWALLLGFRMRIVDLNGRVVLDPAHLVGVPPRTKGATPKPPVPASKGSAEYTPYPLFLRGEQIGTLEVQYVHPAEEATFIARSNRFLLLSVLAMGGVALALSAFASRRLTRPLNELAAAAAALSRGDLSVRSKVYERDEVGSLAESFNAMALALGRLEDLRRKLLTNLAHEFRTPLSAIRGELEAMMDGLIRPGKEELRSLHEEAGRLKRMMDGCEDLARAQASAATMSREQIPLRRFLGQLLERESHAGSDKAVNLRLECSEDLVLSADPDKLTQILVNLTDNAIKAVAREGTVTIRAVRAGQHVDLSVTDDGVGIEPSDLPFIFERFYRRSAGGLGIGLAIAKELVEAHGGTIEAESVPGQGAVFTMHFPS